MLLLIDLKSCMSILLMITHQAFSRRISHFFLCAVFKEHIATVKQIRPCGLSGNDLLSRDPAVQVPSALEGLTAVFGMGTGGSPPPLSPDIKLIQLGSAFIC